MPDYDPMAADKPIIIPDTPLWSQVFTFARDAGLVVGAVITLFGALTGRDVAQLRTVFASNEVLTAIGILMVVLILAWRQLNARKVVSKLQTLEPYAPSSVAMTHAAASAAASPPDPTIAPPPSRPTR